MVDITLEDGTVIEATDGHPFWSVTARAFVDAVELKIGDRVLGSDGSELRVAVTTFYVEDLTAYNLEIDGIHTYYAGDTPVLVHNACDLDVDGINHAIENHTSSGAGFADKVRSGESAGVWDEGVDLHELAPRTDNLEGVQQLGDHDSILFRVDAGSLIGTAGNGMPTSVYHAFRDRWSGSLISMFPVAP